MATEPILVVHGGAGDYSSLLTRRDLIEEDVVKSASAGYTTLKEGGSAIDAVVAAVTVMEDSPMFNAGKGSYLTSDGTIEMDASIMDGSDLNTGAISCISNVANPIHVARLVMDKSQHVFFTGEGAQRFAQEMGVKHVHEDYLITEKARDRLEKHPSFNPKIQPQIGLADDVTKLSVNDDEHDTVGAVAMDKNGNVAFANSTGGMTGKKVGRVGDSPIVGCGGYADNLSGAVATTGHGEAFIKMCTASHACHLMKRGETAEAALKIAVDDMFNRVGGVGGCIAIDSRGKPGIYFNSQGMSWASVCKDEIRIGLLQGEEKSMSYVDK